MWTQAVQLAFNKEFSETSLAGEERFISHLICSGMTSPKVLFLHLYQNPIGLQAGADISSTKQLNRRLTTGRTLEEKFYCYPAPHRFMHWDKSVAFGVDYISPSVLGSQTWNNKNKENQHLDMETFIHFTIKEALRKLKWWKEMTGQHICFFACKET